MVIFRLFMALLDWTEKRLERKSHSGARDTCSAKDLELGIKLGYAESQLRCMSEC